VPPFRGRTLCYTGDGAVILLHHKIWNGFSVTSRQIFRYQTSVIEDPLLFSSFIDKIWVSTFEGNSFHYATDVKMFGFLTINIEPQTLERQSRTLKTGIIA